MRFLIFISFVILFFSCQNKQDVKHFITDNEYRIQVENDFQKTKVLAKNREQVLFSVFDDSLSVKEEEALEFLYAYMPLSDLADYNGDFFLRNVRLAFQAKKEMPWGKKVPEDVFRHFVLPYRINNENLDSARLVFYKELKPRIEHLDLKEAILEVNHWCREKVIYQPTDDRTISPLGAIKSVYGRCGEESTFTVTALRSVGIPARQCYTPRWAHTDDNHAWVEVWVDGNWHFLGACEPEADLDIAWFSAPALRAMLVHTKVFGKYEGEGDIIQNHDKYTELNVLKSYAPVKRIFVKVLDENELTVEDATVEFQLYNYAEYYPIATKTSHKDGFSSLETGLGDLLIWVHKDGKFAYKKISVANTDTLTINLIDADFTERVEDLDLTPPIARTPKSVSDEGRTENDKRLKVEDGIREAYISTFISDEKINELAIKYHFSVEQTKEILKGSRGNWKEIKQFIEQAYLVDTAYVIDFLSQLSKKDWRDAEFQTLLGLYQSAIEHKSNSALFVPYVLNPRIDLEGLRDYKLYLKQKFEIELAEDTLATVSEITSWIKDNILLSDKNYYKVILSPQGIHQLGYADEKSRDIFFVAVCRTLGIASRLEPASRVPQFYTDGEWQTVIFEQIKTEKTQLEYGDIRWEKPKGMEKDIEYRVHFSLSYFENGRYNILEYGWGKLFSELEKTIHVREGHYLLITSNRKADGSVLTRNRFFNVEKGEIANIVLDIRDDFQALKPIKRLETAISYTDANGEKHQLSEKGSFVLAWIENDKETTNHTLKDISKVKESFDAERLPIYLFFESIHQLKDFDASNFDLPSTLVMAVQNDYSSIIDKVHALPLYTFVKDNQVYYLSQGYQIGIGEQLIKFNNNLKEIKSCRIDGQDL